MMDCTTPGSLRVRMMHLEQELDAAHREAADLRRELRAQKEQALSAARELSEATDAVLAAVALHCGERIGEDGRRMTVPLESIRTAWRGYAVHGMRDVEAGLMVIELVPRSGNDREREPP